MAKEKWGTKRTCPKCGERFYDLKKDDPVTCIECGTEWVPEPLLKTKQPLIVEKETTEPKADDVESDADDLDTDVDSSGDDDDDILGDVSLDDDDDTEVSAMVDTSMATKED